ncbi:MAG: thiamine-phosphate kinase [Thaumarchaeota archaeon]|nr:thiamine-phosphate kinase [Nitrososphaerota archaeon]
MKIITGLAGNLPRSYWAIGDDVATVPTKGRKLVIKCDMLVDRTDVPPGMSYRQAARKAVAMCVSDFSAKGVKPDSFLISLGLRSGVRREDVVELAEGFRDASREWGVKFVGGDTNESADLIVDCSMVGFAGRVVARSGAKPDQLVVTSGYFGYSSSGLKILIKGAKARRGFRAAAVASVLNPHPRLKLGIALAKYFSSAMDSSDGLAITLHTLAERSGVGIRVDKLPCDDEVRMFAKRNGFSEEELALYGGEEYEIVATIERRHLPKARDVAARLDVDLLVIGRTTKESGVVSLKKDQREERILRKGWVHLS